MSRPSVLLFPAVALLAAALIACGGKGSPASDEEAAGAAAAQSVRVLLGLFDGSTHGKDLLEVFAPECREGVKASDIDSVLFLIRAFVPDLGKTKIEAVDLGELRYNRTSEGIEVTPKDTSAIRVKADGKWMAADEFFQTSGLGNSDEQATDEPLLMVKRNGKWYIGDCAQLQDFSSPLGSSGSPTPSSGGGRASATAAPSGPGSSRANPIKLGQPGRVEDLWEVTVLAVDRDAWPKVQAANRFNDAPGPNEKMVMVRVRAKNVSRNDKAENIDGFSFRLVGSRNQLYSSFDAKTQCGVIPDELDADLFPNGQTEGNVCFKVPADETGLLLVWREFLSDRMTYFALE
jgi:hypothetical protein